MSDSTSNESFVDSNAESTGWLERLRKRWGLTSLFQVVIILIVFSVTGSTVVFLRKAFFSFLGFDELTPFWIKTVAYLLFVFPAYQLLILLYGFLFGQFAFFWDKEKRMLRAIRGLFTRK